MHNIYLFIEANLSVLESPNCDSYQVRSYTKCSYILSAQSDNILPLKIARDQAQLMYSQVSINVTCWEYLKNSIYRIITSYVYRMNTDD